MGQSVRQSVRLTDLFASRRDELRQRLAQNNTVEAAQRVLRAFLDQLFLDYQQAQTEQRRSRLLNGLADCIAAGTELLLAANRATVWHASTTPEPNELDALRPAGLWWPPIVRVVAAALLAGWLFVIYPGTTERVLAGIGLGVVIVMEFIGGLVPAMRRSRARRLSQITWPPPQTRSTVELDLDVLLLRLRDVLVMADKVLDQAAADAQLTASPALPIPDPLIDYLQELSAAHVTNDAQYALALARRVPSLLVPYDITLLTTTDTGQRNRFSLVTDLEGDSATGGAPHVIRPALLKGDTTLRRGEIAVPAQR